MREIEVPCGTCNGDGFVSTGDRHAETRKDVCPTCGGRGTVRAATGEGPGSSASPVEGRLYAGDLVFVPDPHGHLYDEGGPYHGKGPLTHPDDRKGND